MKPVYISFVCFIKQIFKDSMLAAMTILPLFLGFLFKFGVLSVEMLIADKIGIENCLQPYYLLFDLPIGVTLRYFIIPESLSSRITISPA